MPLILVAKSLSKRTRPNTARGEDAAPVDTVCDRHQAWAYPISRWYLRPLAAWTASRLIATQVRPGHLTAFGLIFGGAACGLLLYQPGWAPMAALLVVGAWFFDRLDGQLARLQNTATPFGAWLDANIDELLDVSWHVVAAAVLAGQWHASWPWLLVLAFLAGKYLFMYSLATDGHFGGPKGDVTAGAAPSSSAGWLRTIWHLPGNADVRVHLLIAAWLSGCLAAELAFVASYYSLRWIARYVLVARRLGGAQ
jgi:phosphatidylglycerophosphate synthase